MEVVFLYGPPAAGKLTIAIEIVRRTGFTLYDNHTSFDRVLKKYPFMSPEFVRVTADLRKRFFRESARQGRSFVFTFCYVYKYDDDFVNECVNLVEGFGGKIHFVQVLPSLGTLLQRVRNDERTKKGKIVDEKILLEVLNGAEFKHQIPGRKSLSINNDSISAADASELIIETFRLPRV